MRTFLWRHRFKLIVVMFPLALAALVLLVTGKSDLALILLAGYMVLLAIKEIIDWRCEPAPPRLGPEKLAAIRVERDSAGETAAVRMLRSAHPDLGLRESALLVRNL